MELAVGIFSGLYLFYFSLLKETIEEESLERRFTSMICVLSAMSLE
jgi:hypothetical protein